MNGWRSSVRQQQTLPARSREMSEARPVVAVWLKVLLCFLGAFLLTVATWLLITSLYPAEVQSDLPSPPSSALPPPPQTTAKPQQNPCQNGGSYISQFQGCLCPDQWKGFTCNESNSCKSQTFPGENVSFPSVTAGTNANSNEVCPKDTFNAGLPQATVFCSTNLTFTKPFRVDCEKTLTELLDELQTPPSEEKALEVVSSTQLITSQPEKLKKDNIENAVAIVVKILNNTQITNNTEVTNAAVTTVSQLLEAPANQFDIEVTQSLTKQMEAFSLEGANITQKSIAVKSVELLQQEYAGVLFTALKVTENNDTTFLSNSINVENNVSQFTVNPNAEIQLFINATGNTNTNSSVKIGFVLYQNDKFFKSVRFQSKRNFSRKIISGNLPSKNLYNVQLAVKPQEESRFLLQDFACVFWNYSQGDWDTEGCVKIVDGLGILKCFCNHTTNFAILMSFRQNYTYAKPLQIVSIVGCALSITGLTVTIVFQLINRPKKTRRSSSVWTLVSLCTSILIFNILFLAGVENKYALNEQNDPGQNMTEENRVLEKDIVTTKNDWCTAVTALLHYFLLATFAWTAIIAGKMYMDFILIFSASPRYLKLIQAAIGWGVPAVIVAITFGSTYPVDVMNYRQEEFCWLAALNEDKQFDIAKPMLWAFLLPIGLILIFNIFIFLSVTVRVICNDRNRPTSTRKGSYIKKTVNTLTVAMTLGITWVVGYLLLIQTDSTTANIFAFAFCFLNATQGIQIFALYTLRSPTFLKQVTKLFNKLSSPRLYLHSKKYHMIHHQTKTLNEHYKLHMTTSDSMGSTLSTTAG